MSYIPAGPATTAPRSLNIVTVPTGAAAAVAVSATGVRAVQIVAHEDNQYSVRVGDNLSSVSNTPPLFSRDVRTFSIDNPNKIYSISAYPNQKIYVTLIY